MSLIEQPIQENTIQKEIKEKEEVKLSKYNYGMLDNKYLTPPVLITGGLQILSRLKGDDLAIESAKFDLDVCCSNHNIPAKEYYTSDSHDGLTEPWRKYNWCNPPFDQCDKWVKKAWVEASKGNFTIMLIPVRTETAYWHDYILFNKNVDIHWLRKGFKFLNAETKEEMGIFKNALAYVVFKGINQ